MQEREGGPVITVCPRSSGPFYLVTYFIEVVTTSWRHSKSLFFSIWYIDNTQIGLRIRVVFRSSDPDPGFLSPDKLYPESQPCKLGFFQSFFVIFPKS